MESSTQDIVAFCQAPQDMAKIVTLYANKPANCSFHIYVINVKANFDFLMDLNLDAKIYYVKHKKLSNPLNIISMFFYLHKHFIKKIRRYKNAKIYFFSQYFDYVTPIFLSRLDRSNEFYFINIYKPELKLTSTSFIRKIFFKVFDLFFNVKLYPTKIGIIPSYFYKLPTSTNEIELETKVPEKFQKNHTHNDKTSILLFEANGNTEPYFTNYSKDLEKLISLISSRFKIYIKPHPRLGYSPSLNDNSKFTIVSGRTPSEFINPNQFSCILGIETSGTKDFVEKHPHVYSIIDLFSFKDNADEFYKSHLKTISNNKMKFITSFDELNKKLSQL